MATGKLTKLRHPHPKAFSMRHLFLLTSFLFACSLFGQSYHSRIHRKVRMASPNQIHQLILIDYTKLMGTALEVSSDSIYFALRDSEDITVIPLSNLRFLGLFSDGSGGYSGNGRPRDNSPIGLSDLTYERTALPSTNKGQLRIVQLAYAVTEWNINENIQLGVGLLSPLVVTTTQKFRWSLSEQVHVGISNQIGLPITAQGFNAGTPLVIGDLTSMLTFGTENRFVNVGTGIFYNTDRFESSPTARNYRMGIGGRLSPKWYLYSELVALLSASNRETNFRPRRRMIVLPSVNAALAVRRHRWSFGLASFIIDQSSVFPVPIPYVGYSYYWGRL